MVTSYRMRRKCLTRGSYEGGKLSMRSALEKSLVGPVHIMAPGSDVHTAPRPGADRDGGPPLERRRPRGSRRSEPFGNRETEKSVFERRSRSLRPPASPPNRPAPPDARACRVLRRRLVHVARSRSAAHSTAHRQWTCRAVPKTPYRSKACRDQEHAAADRRLLPRSGPLTMTEGWVGYGPD
jgi:hypothetical protein